MQMSSMSVNTKLMNCWNVAGALVRPKGITSHS